MSETPCLWVRCTLCNHVWIAMHFPMVLLVAAKLLKHLHCPACGAAAEAIKMKEDS